jgi:CysZ protein
MSERRGLVPAAPNPPRFLDGARCFLVGFSHLSSDASAAMLAVVPVGVALVLMSTLASLGAWFLPDLALGLVATEGVWAGLLRAAVSILAVALGLVVGFALAKPASGPALEAIVRRVEARLGLPARPDTPFWLDVRRSLASSVVVLALIGLLTLVLFVVGLVPVVGVVAVPLELGLTLFVLGWDLCDVPLSARGLGVRERLSLVARHLPALLGFSAAMGVFSFVPCGLFVLLPVGVAGATELVARMRGELAPTPEAAR